MDTRYFSLLLGAICLISSATLVLAGDLSATQTSDDISAGTVRQLDVSLQHPVAHDIKGLLLHPVDSTLVGSFPSPSTMPRGLAFDGTYLWNGDDNGSVYKLDASTGAILGTYSHPGSYPCGLTWDGWNLWIGDFGTGTIYKIDTTSFSVVKSFSAPGSGFVFDLAFDGTDLYGAFGNDGYIIQFDTISGAVIQQINATYSSPNPRPFGLAYVGTGGGEVWTSDGGYGSNLMNIWDCGTSAWVNQWATNPTSYPCGIAYDPVSGLMWVSCWDTDAIYIYDVGPQAPPENILFVDDDESDTTEVYWETSFANLAYPFDKWCVYDSSDVAPDSADMSNYTIVVWTTGEDYMSGNTITPTDSAELEHWLGAGGKLWLSSQDVLFDIGPLPWMHLAGYTGDVGCDSCMGIGPVMNGTAFYTTGGAITDYSDNLIPDGISWAELLRDYADTNAVAIDTSAGEPYFVFFNAFGWENINTEADRDTMMKRVLSWMGFLPGSHDVGVQTVTSPPAGTVTPGSYDVTGTVRNYGDCVETFDVIATVWDTIGWTVVFGPTTLNLANFPVGADTNLTFGQVIFAPQAYYCTEIYTALSGDDDPANDTASVISQTALALGDIIFEMDAETPTGDIRLLGVEFDGTYFYCTGARNMDSAFVYVLDTLGNLIWTMPQPAYSHGTWGWRDIAWDNAYAGPDRCDTLYASVNNNVDPFGIDLATGTMTNYSSFSGPENPNRALAFYDDNSWFYTANFSSNVYWFDKAGPIGNVANTYAMYGAAFDTDTTGGGWIWWHSQDDPGTGWPGQVEQYDPATQTFTGVNFGYVPTITVPAAAGGACFHEGFRGADVLFVMVQGSPDAIVGLFIRYHIVPGVEEEPAAPPLVFGLARTAPNPVSNGATIAYTTTQEGPVSLRIYDASGRLIRTLVDAIENGGRKTVRWDGRDNHDRAVAAGVYFYRLTAEDKTASQKMVVVR